MRIPSFSSAFRLRAALVIALVGLGVGCALKPEIDNIDPPDDFQYPALDTPQHTLSNLKHAWDRKDSTRTRLIYDDAYEGVALNEDPLQPPYRFSKDQEVAVVWAIGKDPAVTSTSIDFPAESTWVREHYPSDPEGWATIYVFGHVTLQVTVGTSTTQATNSEVEYKFKPYVTGADTVWKIVKWTEVPKK